MSRIYGFLHLVARFIFLCLGWTGGRGDRASELGEQPEPCCLPFRFQAIIVPLNSFTVSEQKVQRVTRDWGARLQVQESLAISSQGIQTVEYRIIYDFSEMTRYVSTPDGCQTREITYGMLEPCMPDDAIYLGKSYLGQYTDQTDFHAWYFRRTDYNRDIEMTIAVTSDGCVPIMEHITGSMGGGEAANTLVLFTNLTETVDQEAFDIPPECYV